MNARGGFRPRADVRFRMVAGEAVVLLQDAREVLALNEVGACILELIDRELTMPEIVDCLAEEFDADHDVLEADASEFLQELLENGVIEAVSEDEVAPDGT